MVPFPPIVLQGNQFTHPAPTPDTGSTDGALMLACELAPGSHNLNVQAVTEIPTDAVQAAVGICDGLHSVGRDL